MCRSVIWQLDGAELDINSLARSDALPWSGQSPSSINGWASIWLWRAPLKWIRNNHECSSRGSIISYPDYPLPAVENILMEQLYASSVVDRNLCPQEFEVVKRHLLSLILIPLLLYKHLITAPLYLLLDFKCTMNLELEPIQRRIFLFWKHEMKVFNWKFRIDEYLRNEKCRADIAAIKILNADIKFRQSKFATENNVNQSIFVTYVTRKGSM